MIEINKIYNADCLDLMKEIEDKSIDLVLTSPPYGDLRLYDTGHEYDFQNTAKELFRIIKDGGVAVWIIGDQVKDGSETLTPFYQAIGFDEIGFRIHDTMIYQKNVMPFPEQTRYIQCFEYMFILTKGKIKTHNLLKEKTKGYKPSPSSSQRNKDGTITKLKGEQGKELRNKWNVWLYDVGYNKTTKDKYCYQHPAMFPEQLAKDHILSWSNEGDLICDPFMGSGTTAVMAIETNRNYIGSEISREYYDLCIKRINEHKKQGRLFNAV